MRKMFFSILVVYFLLLATLISLAGTGDNAGPGKDGKSNWDVEWEVPIAAGVYYPSDGDVPDHPVRYYRVRCWPGCHSGSSYGMYPGLDLEEEPIFPTSTIDMSAEEFQSSE